MGRKRRRHPTPGSRTRPKEKWIDPRDRPDDKTDVERPLPLWFDEGLAELVAALVLEDSPVHEARAPVGLRFIKTRGPIENILDMKCLHEGWHGPHGVEPSVT